MWVWCHRRIDHREVSQWMTVLYFRNEGLIQTIDRHVKILQRALRKSSKLKGRPWKYRVIHIKLSEFYVSLNIKCKGILKTRWKCAPLFWVRTIHQFCSPCFETSASVSAVMLSMASSRLTYLDCCSRRVVAKNAGKTSGDDRSRIMFSKPQTHTIKWQPLQIYTTTGYLL
jgi:hypothetical protein